MRQIGVLGHIAIDTIITREASRLELGGSPTYISLIFQATGIETVAVTKVGYDFPKNYSKTLEERGISVSPSLKKPTTRFILDYTGSERGLLVPTICDPIQPLDIGDLPETTIIAPIIGEIPDETLKEIRSTILAIDPQGFVRHREPDGNIVFHKWLDREVLARTSILKASERELRLMVGIGGWDGLGKINQLGVRVALVTKGSAGSDMLVDGARYSIPAYDRIKIVDVTGAGDSFIAGFISEFSKGESPEWCASYASAAASSVIETLGPRLTVDKTEINRRAEVIFDGVVRLP
jgi:sugar/nucleoside kinase (ribokinase family)